jgi:cytochrome c biogenesis protein
MVRCIRRNVLMEDSKIKLKKEEGFIETLLSLFKSLKLTIALLILLALLSIIGTFIQQNASSAEYIQRYGIDLYNVLSFFNLFDMYHSWWFSAILFILVINLITCSIYRLPGVWSQAFRKPDSGGLKDSMVKTLPYVERVQLSNLAKRERDLQSSLKKWFKMPIRFETESAVTLFSEKGKRSRLGIPITHLSILIILIGGLMGSLFGFRGYVNILEGETVDRIYLRVRDQDVEERLGFKVRCDDFNITYYNLPGNEKHVKEYASTLTILENGQEVLREMIKVNHPLHYKGMAFYQSSYGSIHDISLGVQRKNGKEKTVLKMFEGETIPIPNSNTQVRLLRYIEQVHTFGEGVQVALFKPDQRPQTIWVFKDFQDMKQQGSDDLSFTLEGVNSKEYTGLQVARDPGVWIVWLGSGLMIFGLIVSFFFSHQRVWVRIPKNSEGEIVVAGSANKNRVGFEKTFVQLVEELRKKS